MGIAFFVCFCGWTADARALTYIVTQGGVSNIWTQPTQGGPSKQMTDFKSLLIYSFDWTRDGKQLVLARGTIQNDVVMTSNFQIGEKPLYATCFHH